MSGFRFEITSSTIIATAVSRYMNSKVATVFLCLFEILWALGH